MSCPSCNYGDDCCEGVWLDVKEKLAKGDVAGAALQAVGRMCSACLLRVGAIIAGEERQ